MSKYTVQAGMEPVSTVTAPVGKAHGGRRAESDTMVEGKITERGLGLFENFFVSRVVMMEWLTEPEARALIRETRKVQRHYVRDKAKMPFITKSWMFSFYGFASARKRNLFLRLMRYMLKPRMLVASQVSDDRFEGLCFINPISHAESETHTMADVERVVELFKMSIGVCELDSYMGNEMISCFERIQKGNLWYGNITNVRNGNILRTLRRRLQERQQAEIEARVRAETNLPFTPQNMLSLHRELQNLTIDTATARHRIEASRNVVEMMMADAVTQQRRMQSMYVMLIPTVNPDNGNATDNYVNQTLRTTLHESLNYQASMVQDLTNMRERLTRVWTPNYDSPVDNNVAQPPGLPEQVQLNGIQWRVVANFNTGFMSASQTTRNPPPPPPPPPLQVVDLTGERDPFEVD